MNTARGELVDEDDLYDALKSGKLSGAHAGRFSSEPPPPDCKLLELENFILTALSVLILRRRCIAWRPLRRKHFEMLQDDLDG